MCTYAYIVIIRGFWILRFQWVPPIKSMGPPISAAWIAWMGALCFTTFITSHN